MEKLPVTHLRKLRLHWLHRESTATNTEVTEQMMTAMVLHVLFQVL